MNEIEIFSKAGLKSHQSLCVTKAYIYSVAQRNLSLQLVPLRRDAPWIFVDVRSLKLDSRPSQFASAACLICSLSEPKFSA